MWKWIRGAEMWVSWIVLSLLAFTLTGGFLLGLKYSAAAKPDKVAEVTDMLTTPLWGFALMAVGGVLGARATHRADRKAKADLAAWKAEQAALGRPVGEER
ncbi:hypothetical protein [Streptomyces sp. NPDC013489]|uniref:hypothetical protein n=1 Tax=Streptomyces sp. NPDC013489 TaxID=3155606 RepID=UPI0033C34416